MKRCRRVEERIQRLSDQHIRRCREVFCRHTGQHNCKMIRISIVQIWLIENGIICYLKSSRLCLKNCSSQIKISHMISTSIWRDHTYMTLVRARHWGGKSMSQNYYYIHMINNTILFPYSVFKLVLPVNSIQLWQNWCLWVMYNS